MGRIAKNSATAPLIEDGELCRPPTPSHGGSSSTTGTLVMTAFLVTGEVGEECASVLRITLRFSENNSTKKHLSHSITKGNPERIIKSNTGKSWIHL